MMTSICSCCKQNRDSSENTTSYYPCVQVIADHVIPPVCFKASRVAEAIVAWSRCHFAASVFQHVCSCMCKNTCCCKRTLWKTTMFVQILLFWKRRYFWTQGSLRGCTIHLGSVVNLSVFSVGSDSEPLRSARRSVWVFLIQCLHILQILIEWFNILQIVLINASSTNAVQWPQLR